MFPINQQFGLVFVSMDQMKVKRLEETSITIDQMILGFNKIIAISSSQDLHL
jgi:dimeric dUTPase (all-alpha-NTP-PPase superfamily)